MNRRDALRLMASSLLLSSNSRLFATPRSAPRFLLVFLRGGYDCNHLLVPYTSSLYYELRPTLALSSTEQHPLLPLSTEWALAASVTPYLTGFLERGEISFVPFAGVLESSRSHFKVQRYIESGWMGPSAPRASGFMGRLAQHLSGTKAIAFTQNSPDIFKGISVPHIPLRTLPPEPLPSTVSQSIQALYRDTPYADTLANGFNLRRAAHEAFAQETEEANKGAPAAESFSLEAARIATLMRDEYRLGMVDIGGWDTHVTQGAETGLLAKRLASLAKGLATYADTLGAEEWRNTTVVVISEFGRTMKENGNKGTDHGFGTVYWILGGGPRKPAITGHQTDVSADTLHQERDYPVLNSLDSVLAPLLSQQWGVHKSLIQKSVFGA